MGRIKITKQRKLITYSDLWRTSEVLLDRAKAEPVGSYYPAVASLAFSAFALEAFLNHIGEHLFATWREIEVLSPKAKIHVLCERLRLTPNWGTQPWQVVPQIIGFRNKIAHGKNELLTFEAVVPQDEKYDAIWREFLFSDWQTYATAKNAELVRDRLLALFKMIHAKANIKGDLLFHHGSQFGSAESLPE